MLNNPKYLLDEGYIQERNLKNVKQIEQGEIKVGDVVYDSYLCEDVVVLDLPDPKRISIYNYRAFPYIRNYCKTLDGKIERSGYLYYVKISKGNYYVEYEIEGKGKELQIKVDFFEYLARGEGFRVEKVKIKKGHLLKFFGDSQQQVNEFLEDAKYTFGFWHSKK